MRGIYPSNDSMAEVGYPRIKQAFLNMQWLAEYAGAELTDSLAAACVGGAGGALGAMYVSLVLTPGRGGSAGPCSSVL